jgi:hypothetical protein
VVEVKRGVTRTVYLIGRWAIKVPSLRVGKWGLRKAIHQAALGIAANNTELEWSGVVGVAPVRASLFGVVQVYDRCLPVCSFDGDYSVVCDVRPVATFDCKPQNLGVLSGRVVWVDYA